MASYFLDTSALAKHYHAEHGTDKVDALFAEASSARFVARLAVTELHSVFAARAREGTIDDSALNKLIGRVLADISRREYEVVATGEAVFLEADRLLRTYATSQHLRTLDALHLGAAVIAKGVGVDVFVTADVRQGQIATAEGFQVLNPAS